MMIDNLSRMTIGDQSFPLASLSISYSNVPSERPRVMLGPRVVTGTIVAKITVKDFLAWQHRVFLRSIRRYVGKRQFRRIRGRLKAERREGRARQPVEALPEGAA